MPILMFNTNPKGSVNQHVPPLRADLAADSVSSGLMMDYSFKGALPA